MRKFYSQFINENDLCFDVGANIGIRTTVFLTLGAKVVSVEPDPRAFQKLKNRFEIESNVQLVPKGISDEAGTGILNLGSLTDVSSLSETFIQAYSGQKGIEWNDQVEIPLTTLDDLIVNYGIPVFCKIDIEGHEPIALRALSTPIKYISVEYNNRLISKAIDSVEIISKLGEYVYQFSEYESMEFKLKEWVDKKELINFLHKIQSEVLTGDIYAWHRKSQ